MEPKMTEDQMVAFAREVVAGRKTKREEVVLFMRSLLAQVEAGDAEIGPSPVPVDRTDAGIFLGPNTNRWYTKREARALAREISRAVD